MATRPDRCYWCGEAGASHADHVIAVALGGTHTLSNLVRACGPCNLSRGARLGPPPNQNAPAAR